MILHHFYMKDKYGHTIKTYNKFCVKPRATKHYKYIMNMLDREDNNVHSVGYTINTNEL
jgi:hypothetical protein